jgi:hypothetical protein
MKDKFVCGTLCKLDISFSQPIVELNDAGDKKHAEGCDMYAKANLKFKPSCSLVKMRKKGIIFSS